MREDSWAFVADVLHPIYDLTLKTFLNGDMGQSCPGRASLTRVSTSSRRPTKYLADSVSASQISI